MNTPRNTEKETLSVLCEIRDEIKTMNAHIQWLKDKAVQTTEAEEAATIKTAELKNKKSTKDLLAIVIIAVGIGIWFLLAK